jgi:hypothetical protein
VNLSTRLNLLACGTVLGASIGVGLAVAQPDPRASVAAPTAPPASAPVPQNSLPPVPVLTTPSVLAPGSTGGGIGADSVGAAGGTTAPAVASSAPPVPDQTAAALTSAREALKAGNDASTAGNTAAAVTAWRQVVSTAPQGAEGDREAMEAARRLGFASLEARDARGAETWFAAEAILARRLFIAGLGSHRRLFDAVGRWASATGAMGRSTESDALVNYARFIRDRTQASASTSVLRREASDEDTGVGDIRVNSSSAVCAVGREPLLASRVSCEDEAGALTEALSLRANQLRAPADRDAAERREAAEKAKKSKKK